MEDNFTQLEIQLIRSSLSTKTDAQIAEILERSIADIRKAINVMTGGAADDREIDVKRFQEEQAAAKIKVKKPAVRKVKLKSKEMKKAESPKAEKVRQAWEKQTAENKKKHDRSIFKTIEVDLNKLISVKIDNKTTIFVKPGTDIELAKQNYQLRHLKQSALKD